MFFQILINNGGVLNKPGRAQVGAISKAQKITKGLFQVSIYNTRKSKNQKVDRVARRGPLARAPGALKGELFRNCQHFCRS